jgi:hypothetical protein
MNVCAAPPAARVPAASALLDRGWGKAIQPHAGEDAPGSDGKKGRPRHVFLFRRHGRSREMGLGSFTSVSLSRARDLAAEARQTVARGIDPIEARPNADAGLRTVYRRE